MQLALAFVASAFYFGTVNAQLDNIKREYQNQARTELSAFAISLSYARSLSPSLKPGAGVLIGMQHNLSFTTNRWLNQREHLTFFAFNRFQIRSWLEMDAGIRTGYITLVDHNPKEGFRHLSFTGLYLNPMFGKRFLKGGFLTGVGIHDDPAWMLTPLILRYKLDF